MKSQGFSSLAAGAKSTRFWGNGKMETAMVYWGYIGMIENEMETTI